MRICKRVFLLMIWPISAIADIGAVDGAFGIALGEALEVSSLEKVGEDNRGGEEYAFTPEAPYAPLTKYSVFVTPASHTVYKIVASGAFGSMNRCKDELLRLENLLAEKYVKVSGEMSERFGDVPRIRFGKSPRQVTASCTGIFNRKNLTLSYQDEDVTKQIKTELRKPSRNEEGASGTVPTTDVRDASGL